MIPAEDTRILMEVELEGARSWAERHSIPLKWLPEPLEVRVTFTQPETGEQFYLRGRFDSYRALPPEWVFTDADWEGTVTRQQLFPKTHNAPFGSMFILNNTGPVICAHFNRLAFHQHGGPHSDWGGPANWLTASSAQYVRAEMLGDMLQLIYRDVVYSRGRMGT